LFPVFNFTDMKHKLKLKHLDFILDEDRKNVADLMVDVLGYKNSLIGKLKFFGKSFGQINKLIEEVSSINYKEIPLNLKSHIKKPNTVNDISYLQMLNLKSLIENENKFSMSVHMAKVIAICTYSENRISKYNPESKSFKLYVDNILKVNMLDMIALYYWILKDLKETSKKWDELFMSVHIEDKDLENAGGAALSQFNVIKTIISSCQDFNVNDEEAMYKSYNLIMQTSYSKAFSAYIQENIRIAKEAEYERNKKKK
jgi:hypothetical protein